MNKIKILFAIFAISLTSVAFAVDLAQVEKELTTTGVVGWIHGSVSDRDLYVFTYRTPGSFFDYVEISLVAEKPEIASKLPAFNRHDKVRIKGSFLKNPSPQKHISVASIEMVEKYQSSVSADAYQYEAKIPDDLLKAGSAEFLVHAIGADGAVLVTEYKDQIVPVYVKKPELTRGLWRNDVVKLQYKLQTAPDSPTHLNLDDSTAEPVKVLESIQSLHGKPAVVEGSLILFPKSPEIIFNVFAVQQDLPNGLKRQFTLVNFDDPVAFGKIRAKLQTAWDKGGNDFINGRNKFVSRRIRVRATGTFNEIDANQANPQVLLKNADSIQVID